VFFFGRDRYVSKLKMSIGKQFLQLALPFYGFGMKCSLRPQLKTPGIFRDRLIETIHSMFRGN
jgi:hypothetical protein